PAASQCHSTSTQQHTTNLPFAAHLKVAAKGIYKRVNFDWLLSFWFLLLALQIIVAIILFASLIFPYCGEELHCDKTVIDEGVPDDNEEATGCIWPLKSWQHRGLLFAAFTAAASICVNISIGFLSSFNVENINGFSLCKCHLLCAGSLALLNLAAGSVASWYTYDQKYLPTVGCQFYKQWVVSTVSAFANFILYASDFMWRTAVLLKK
ncbi:hypothetical protein M513_01982, partial [Trichuris suis]